MSSLETTELKLKSTPTGGAEAHVSPYYRRLVSAGYKGFLQGTIGGASLYGTMGAVVGGLLAIPLLFIPGFPALAALALLPAGAGLGLVKGANTFGNIGSVAAINAESADLSEQRRYLLDMYYDLPDTPDGNARAEAIKQELLARQGESQNPPHFFHWKTLFIGAAIGAVLVAGVLALAPTITSAAGLTELVHSAIGLKLESDLAAAIYGLGKIGLFAVGAGAGALAGGTIGIDRYYIRKWFDHTQDVIHQSSHDYGLMERTNQVQRLQEAAKADAKTKQQQDVGLADAAAKQSPELLAQAAIAKASDSSRTAVAASTEKSETPKHTISEARRQGLLEIQKAMELGHA